MHDWTVSVRFNGSIDADELIELLSHLSSHAAVGFEGVLLWPTWGIQLDVDAVDAAGAVMEAVRPVGSAHEVGELVEAEAMTVA